MDQKIDQYLNKESSTAMEKCLEKLYTSLEKDINLLCEQFDKERSDKKDSIIQDKNIELNNKSLEKTNKRVSIVVKLITDLSNLEQGGTSYLGSSLFY